MNMNKKLSGVAILGIGVGALLLKYLLGGVIGDYLGVLAIFGIAIGIVRAISEANQRRKKKSESK